MKQRAIVPRIAPSAVALFVLVLSLSLTGRADAQDAAHVTATARSLFHEGLECADHDDWTCAVERFEQAYRLRASPVIASNLAAALAHVGRAVEASERYRTIVRDESAPADLRADAERRIAELASRIGRLTLHVEGDATDAVLSIDGRTLEHSMLDVPAPSDLGDHHVEARRDGEVVARADVHVEASTTSAVTLSIPARVTLAPAEIDAAAVLAPVDTPRSPEIYEEWWLWTIVGAVVVGAGVGITVGVLSSETTVLPSGSLETIDGRP